MIQDFEIRSDGSTTDPASAAVLEAVEAMTAAVHAGRLDGVVAAYEQEAAVVFGDDGVPTRGREEIGAAFSGLLALAPRFAFSAHEVLVAGDLALHIAPWSMTGTGPDGAAVEDSGLSVSVLRRQPGGSWALVIDNPHGEPSP